VLPRFGNEAVWAHIRRGVARFRTKNKATSVNPDQHRNSLVRGIDLTQISKRVFGSVDIEEKAVFGDVVVHRLEQARGRLRALEIGFPRFQSKWSAPGIFADGQKGNGLPVRDRLGACSVLGTVLGNGTVCQGCLRRAEAETAGGSLGITNVGELVDLAGSVVFERLVKILELLVAIDLAARYEGKRQTYVAQINDRKSVIESE
jgi:hypothetical protein